MGPLMAESSAVNSFTRLRNYLSNLKAPGPKIDDVDPEDSFLKGRISAFLLFAGMNLMLLCLWFFILGIKDPEQYINMTYTGGTGIFVLMLRRVLNKTIKKRVRRLLIYMYQGVGLLFTFFFSFWIFRYIVEDHVPYMTPVMCPATLFILIVPLHAVYLMKRRHVLLFFTASIIALAFLLSKTLELPLSYDDKMINISFFACHVVLICQITWGGWASKRATDVQSQKLRLARDQALAASREREKINKELMAEITERKKTRSALKESEERYRLLAENATDVIYVTDMNYNITYVSPSVISLRGYSVEEIMNQGLEDTLTPSSLKAIREVIFKKAQQINTINEKIYSRPITIEMEQSCKDGSTVWVETKIRILFDSNGKPDGYLGIARDITYRKRSEQALRESEEKFRMISEQSLIGIVIIQASCVVYVNEKATEISGYSREDILAWKPEEFLGTVHPDYQNQLMEAGKKYTEKEKADQVFHFIFKNITKAGNNTWIEQYSRPIVYNGREALLNIMIDITDRKQQEEELIKYQEHLEELVEGRTAELKAEINDRKLAQEEINRLNKVLEERVRERTAELDKAIEELQELDKMKDSFLSSVSHELRTPLTSIRSFSEILLEYKDEDPETREEFIAIINSESERLTRLINDVLDLSRIEAGGMLWRDELVSIKDIIHDTAKAQDQLFKEKTLRLRIDFSEEIPHMMMDCDRIQQVITNLVGNAAKFSLEGGEIRIRGEMITTCQGDDAMQLVKISISDNGIGIEKEYHKAIFDKFHQVPDDASNSKPRGTGLGLPICKEIITHYNGKIWVESGLEGKGSIFSFTLPITANENKPSAAL